MSFFPPADRAPGPPSSRLDFVGPNPDGNEAHLRETWEAIDQLRAGRASGVRRVQALGGRDAQASERLLGEAFRSREPPEVVFLLNYEESELLQVLFRSIPRGAGQSVRTISIHFLPSATSARTFYDIAKVFPNVERAKITTVLPSAYVGIARAWTRLETLSLRMYEAFREEMHIFELSAGLRELRIDPEGEKDGTPHRVFPLGRGRVIGPADAGAADLSGVGHAFVDTDAHGVRFERLPADASRIPERVTILGSNGAGAVAGVAGWLERIGRSAPRGLRTVTVAARLDVSTTLALARAASGAALEWVRTAPIPARAAPDEIAALGGRIRVLSLAYTFENAEADAREVARSVEPFEGNRADARVFVYGGERERAHALLELPGHARSASAGMEF